MKNSLLPLLALLLGIAPAFAQDYDRTNRIVLGYGQYNFYEDSDQSRGAVRLEARLGKVEVWKLHPWIGVEVGERGGQLYVAGLETDIDLSDEWVLTLQSGIGYFNDGGHNANEDYYPPEGFKARSQIELGYKFENDARISAGFSHASNAGIKFPNPSGNQIFLNVQYPLGDEALAN
ncbi:MAG: hypothetical protein EBQ96_01830 [Proteobacteria bacterium]|nr:hypothetical protein [Pseudomonadota bacterium]